MNEDEFLYKFASLIINLKTIKMKKIVLLAMLVAFGVTANAQTKTVVKAKSGY